VSLVRNTSITIVGRWIAIAAAALTGMVIANTMGAKGAGIFAMVRVFPAVVAGLLGAGITNANPYFIGARKHPVQAVTETTVALGLILGGIGWGGWLLAGELLHAHFYSELSSSAVQLVGLSILLNMLRDYLNSIQQGLLTFGEATAVLTMDDVGSLVLVLPLLRGVENGNQLIVLSAVGGVAMSVVAAAVFLLRKGIRPWPRLHPRLAWESIRFGLRGHVGKLANMLNWRLDVMILSALASTEVVGYYAVASKLAELFRPLSASLTFVLRPVIASLPITEARARGVMLYRRVFLINLAAIVLMALTGKMLIIRLFGPEFIAAVPAFYILLVGLAAHGADGVLNGYNVGIGRPEYNTYTALAGLVITLIGDVLFIPTYSLIAAAVTSSVAYTVKALTFTIVFLVTSGVTLPQLLGMQEYNPEPYSPEEYSPGPA